MWDAIESFPLSRFRAVPTFEHPWSLHVSVA